MIFSSTNCNDMRPIDEYLFREGETNARSGSDDEDFLVWECHNGLNELRSYENPN